jgi:hypothetical protein
MKRAPTLPLRRGGILQLSTWLILAGGTASLMSCDSSERQAMQARASYEAESKRLIEELDSQRQQLLSGEVPNNFHIPGVGYYHADAHDFYEHSYNFQRDNKWFVNNAWLDQAGPTDVPASRPSPEALRRIDETLDKQQQGLDATAATASHYQHQATAGPGLGSTLMMFWLLSGNRGFFSPGPGFTSFGQRAPLWESRYREQRDYQARTPAHPVLPHRIRATALRILRRPAAAIRHRPARLRRAAGSVPMAAVLLPNPWEREIHSASLFIFDSCTRSALKNAFVATIGSNASKTPASPGTAPMVNRIGRKAATFRYPSPRRKRSKTRRTNCTSFVCKPATKSSPAAGSTDSPCPPPRFR